MGIISCGVIWAIGTLSNGLHGALAIGVRTGLVEGPSEGLRAGLGFGLSEGLSYGLSLGGWLAGACGGLVVCSMSGGLATLRHLMLRLLLWHTHTFPWNAPRFLDDASTRILLCHVGGGYSFAHERILNHFASRDNRLPEPEAARLP
jgi:hypothetical protein